MNQIKKLMALIILFTLSQPVISADFDKEKQAISLQAKAFSQAFVLGDVESLMAIYSPNAHIVNGNNKIESDIAAIRTYWTPKKLSNWQLVWHKTVSEELVIDGNLASDIGYYSGMSKHIDGSESKFGGAYVIVWKKINGKWRMHLDMWNSIKE